MFIFSKGFCPNKPAARRVDGDHGYIFTDETIRTYHDAKATCEAEGGRIPVILDSAVLNHVLDFLADNTGTPRKGKHQNILL